MVTELTMLQGGWGVVRRQAHSRPICRGPHGDQPWRFEVDRHEDYVTLTHRPTPGPVSGTALGPDLDTIDAQASRIGRRLSTPGKYAAS
jgi:hypothetical protein